MSSGSTYSDVLHHRAGVLERIATTLEYLVILEGPCEDIPCEVCPAHVPDEGCFYTLLRERAEDLCRKIVSPAGSAPDRRGRKPIIVAGSG